MPWFFGHLSNEEAQIKLAPGSKEGTFLVRFSSQPGAFTISRVATNGTLPFTTINTTIFNICYYT